jgi:SAM-dependent methyltransferase
VLELGSGGGNNASHLKARFEMVVVEPSPAMLAVSRALNPECEHEHGRADLDAGVKDLLFPIRGQAGIGRFSMPDHPGNPAAKLLFVEAERLLAGAAIVQIDVQSHPVTPSKAVEKLPAIRAIPKSRHDRFEPISKSSLRVSWKRKAFRTNEHKRLVELSLRSLAETAEFFEPAVVMLNEFPPGILQINLGRSMIDGYTRWPCERYAGG